MTDAEKIAVLRAALEELLLAFQQANDALGYERAAVELWSCVQDSRAALAATAPASGEGEGDEISTR